MIKANYKVCGLVFVVALLIRLAFMSATDYNSLILSNWGGEKYYDALDYNKLAVNLINNGIYGYGKRSSSYRPPGYPFFLAGIYKVFGHRVWLVRIWQIILGSFCCVIIFLITEKLLSLRFASFAGAVSAVYPFFIFYNLQILSETLFMFFVLVAFWYFIRYKTTNKLYLLLLSGIGWGLGGLTRPLFILLAVIPLVWLGIWYYGNLKHLCLLVTTFLSGILLMVLPWSIRNYNVHGEWVLISTNGGYNFYLGNAEYFSWSGKKGGADAIPPKHILADTDIEQEYIPLTEIEAEKRCYQLGWQFIKNNPTTSIKIFMLKIHDYWHIVLSKKNSSLIRWITGLMYGFILVGGIIGILHSSFKQPDTFSRMIVIFILGATIAHVWFISNIRLRIPLIDPFLIIYTGLGFNHLNCLILRRMRKYGK